MSSQPEEFKYGSFIQKTIRFYINILTFSLQSLKKFWIIPLLLFIGFGLLFFYQFKQTETQYTATTSYTFNYVNNKFYGDLLLEINKLVLSSDSESLSKKLSISNELASNIISFNAVNLVGSPLHEDYTEAHLPFYINVKCGSKLSFEVLQDAITVFLSNNSFVTNYIDETNFFAKENLTFINKDLHLLDSLKQKISVQDALELKNIIELYDAKIEERKNNLIQLNKSKAVSLLNPFQIQTISKNSILKKMAIKYIGLSLLFSLFLTMCLNWVKNDTHEF